MSEEALRIAFAGTPDFAVPALQALIDSPHDVLGVYTQPDRPAGRGRRLQASPIKALAQAEKLPVWQPERLDPATHAKQLSDLQCDLLVVVAYGQILPTAILEAPQLGAWNIHASLLPRWRGAAPIQRAIEAGDVFSGVTIMQMDVGLDTGDTLLKRELALSPQETSASLHDRLAELGAVALLEALSVRGQLIREPQDPALACYARKLKKAEARIDWNEPARVIHQRVRAFYPYPIAETELNGERLRVHAAEVVTDSDSSSEPGEVLAVRPEGVDIACSPGVLRLTRVQSPGAKALQVKQWLHGKGAARVGMRAA